MMILLVSLEMLGESIDSESKNSDLYFGEPVSPSWVAYSAIILFFCSFVIIVFTS